VALRLQSMNLLIQFLLRLSFGLAAGMAITSSKRVTSGYFRNNLYVTLGLTTLAALVSYYVAPQVLWYAVAAAVASYVGSVCWLYEKVSIGRNLLILIAATSLAGAIMTGKAGANTKYQEGTFLSSYFDTSKDVTEEQVDSIRWTGLSSGFLTLASILSSGLLLGMTMAAMLLGHWYLNSPTMELMPLRRLIIAVGVAVALQAIVSGLGLWGEFTYANSLREQWILFVLLRWLFGIIGVGVLAWMAWQTLNIPNTQSATGILYVAVIGTFVGETMALLLSAESLFPL
jgi:MFS family permease